MVVIPVIALLVLALVAPGPRRTSISAAFFVLASIFAVLISVRAVVPDDLLWPNSEAARRARWAVRHLEKKPGWESRPVVVLTGSSATLFGLDPSAIEENLRQNGTPASVLSFSMAGATFAERRHMLESFLRQLGPAGREKLAAARVVFLNEVFDAYDRNPLYRFEKHAFSERCIQFLYPSNALKAWSAYRKQCETEPESPQWSVAGLLAQHVLLNRFAAGAFSAMRWPWSKKRKTAPFFALESSEYGFNFEQSLADWHEHAPSVRSVKTFFPPPQWRTAYSDLAEPLAPFVKTRGFYCLPSIEAHRAGYARAFADWARTEHPVVGPPSAEDMSSLLHRELWFDGVHPTGPGSLMWNEWFARELAKSDVLVMPQPARAM